MVVILTLVIRVILMVVVVVVSDVIRMMVVILTVVITVFVMMVMVIVMVMMTKTHNLKSMSCSGLQDLIRGPRTYKSITRTRCVTDKSFSVVKYK